MTTLTEFLLVRIAEDEAEARHYLDDLAACPPSAYDMAQVGWIEAGSPDRVLAECEAKRRIVETFEGDDADLYDDSWKGADMCARILATVYADHPDYREEWRP